MCIFNVTVPKTRLCITLITKLVIFYEDIGNYSGLLAAIIDRNFNEMLDKLDIGVGVFDIGSENDEDEDR